ncbi:hypothetical protein D5R38_14220 [Serratia marcescens]|nr:hypothetical protein C3F38_23910 [Serratia sp. SSNIH1]POU55262.1 hypothetical protein C3401_07780 [Serratia sp. SSNIH4]POW39704.1 hypothetical protein C3396_08760 [Serratia sp. SSNIH5]POW40103.1 hypothetical protein C3414_08870 [Serratia sp. SSNIH2]POW62143.1 hypothetical protein C3403_08390 [Serratia sp. SSNIH3]QFH61879.1 hypothetical protein FR888_22670 [Serratia marcescens]
MTFTTLCVFLEVTAQAVTKLDNRTTHYNAPLPHRHCSFLIANLPQNKGTTCAISDWVAEPHLSLHFYIDMSSPYQQSSARIPA